MDKPKRLHSIENMDLWGPWESGDVMFTKTGYWSFTPEQANSYIGCWLFLHRHQTAPAHFAGKIVDFRVHDSGRYEGRIVFNVEREEGLEGLITTSDNWNRWWKSAQGFPS
ncbi:MAG: hypothetical protein GXY61_03690 [Lentisphaerae bacterium]|jgi:hypothetical protein|nr:hypothetical protein [Lentisphaerota bacterium]